VAQMFADGSWIWAFLIFAMLMAVPYFILHRMREIDRKEKDEIERIINYAEQNAWHMLEEYQAKKKHTEHESESDETPIYMTIGDDGELVEMNNNDHS